MLFLVYRACRGKGCNNLVPMSDVPLECWTCLCECLVLLGSILCAGGLFKGTVLGTGDWTEGALSGKKS